MTLQRPTTTSLSVFAVALCACATAQPPKELLEARRAYWKAEHSDAARYDPAAVHDAKTALEEAEAMFSESANAPETRDAAYIAMRHAQRARVEGETASLHARRKEAAAAHRQEQAKSAEQMQDDLSTTRSELAQATQARESAEQRAKNALMRLQLSNAAAVVEQPQGLVITVPGGFLFRSGDATLMPAAYPKLDQIAEAVREQGNRKILVEGHTDSRGADAYNMTLSKQRADTVASYLTTHGIAWEKVTAVGVGSSRPVAPNDTPEGRATNRRVEITIEKTEPR